MPTALMLFAAGLGTRMGSLTATRPKPLIEVAGRPLIDHALELAEAVQPRELVVNLHYKGGMIRQHLAGRKLQFSEEPELLETGGGLRAALPLLGPDPVFTLNSDVIWQGPNPLPLLQRAWNPQKMDGLMMLVPQTQTLGHDGVGDFLVDAEGRLQRGAGAIYGGAQIVKTDGLLQIAEPAFSLNQLWDQMLQRGRLYGQLYPGRWCDVGNPQGLALAETLIGTEDV